MSWLTLAFIDLVMLEINNNFSPVDDSQDSSEKENFIRR